MVGDCCYASLGPGVDLAPVGISRPVAAGVFSLRVDPEVKKFGEHNTLCFQDNS